jgi:hypothetical protein
MKTNKSFICFKMLEEGWKFEKLFFVCFQVESKVTSMYKISCLYPLHLQVVQVVSEFTIYSSVSAFK